MSNFKLRGYVTKLTNADTPERAEKALVQLRKDIPSKADQDWVLSQLDPVQRHNIETGFKPKEPQLNDWITHSIGIGYIIQIEGDNCQVLFVESNDAQPYKCKFKGEEVTTKYFRTVLDWLPLKEVRLIPVPAKYKRLTQEQEVYNKLPEQEQIIQDLIEVGSLIETRENLKDFYLDLANAYKSGEVTAEVGKRVVAGLPVKLQNQIEEIKKELAIKK